MVFVPPGIGSMYSKPGANRQIPVLSYAHWQYFSTTYVSPNVKPAGAYHQISVLSSFSNLLPNVRDVKPAGVNCRILVLSCAQSFFTTNVLPNVRDAKPAGINCQISVLSCAQSLSTTNISPNVPDENSQLDHCHFVVFRS